MYKKIYKRLIDLIMAVAGAILLSPLFLILSVFSIIVYRGKIFFLQKRIGYNNQVFIIYKFRTMKEFKDDKGETLKDDNRVNSYGAFLRRFSFDELPQIFNILKGDLSMIGPRPLLVEYLDFYTKDELLRHTVKPGLTGLAQVNGRNSIRWAKRFEYDIYYVKNQSFEMDVRIFIHTLVQLLKGQQTHFSPSLLEERKKNVFHQTLTSN